MKRTHYGFAEREAQHCKQFTLREARIAISTTQRACTNTNLLNVELDANLFISQMNVSAATNYHII